MIRLSSGTASALGLSRQRVDIPARTAYVMVGEGCEFDCSFCPQAMNSTRRPGFLSRVTWPEFSLEEAVEAVAAAYSRGSIERVCLQVVHQQGYYRLLWQVLNSVRAACPAVPVSVSAAVSPVQARELFSLGADRVNIALDAAAPDIYEKVKCRRWPQVWRSLVETAAAHPGRVNTHIIVGLGERECDVVEIIGECCWLGIGVGLFAFTPVPGTRSRHRPAPPLDVYRRVQAAHFLLRRGLVRPGEFTYDTAGRICSYGRDAAEVRKWLSGGEAFMTTGCPGCNRPYYNERPGTIPYNYARRPTAEEAEAAVGELLGVPKKLRQQEVGL